METVESVLPLIGQIDYQATKFNARILFREENFSLILFALQPGQAVPVHKTPMNAYLQCLEGRATVTIGDRTHEISQGDILQLPKEIPHGITGIEHTKLLLIKQA